MADLTETELSALEELERTATAGPWQAHAHMVEAEAGADLIGECSDAYPLGNNNAELIAAARNALPSLLAAARERDELRRQVEAIREACGELPYVSHHEWIDTDGDVPVQVHVIRTINRAIVATESKGEP